MYERNDKRRIYQLIDMYLDGKIDESTFCNEFYYSYDLELPHDSLMEAESLAFYDLSLVTSRFSEFQADHQNYPGVYSTKEELEKKIYETKTLLKNYFNYQ